ncbi:MAG: anthranilate phosphoribosyltransferase [Legionellales bacterium]|nr:anthranilate phosphoribosyltransferase [Legionellales bacterium]
MQYANFIRQLFAPTTSLVQQIDMLQALRLETLTPQKLAECVREILCDSLLLPPLTHPQIDIVGTGGDGKNTFNISTTASFILAASGHRVAKHGNRAVSSRSGSFDCVQALGIPIPQTIVAASQQLQQHQLCFLYAPYFHPQFAKVTAARKILAQQKQKTIFNLLGPLLNPAGVSHLVIGVYDADLIPLMIETCQLLQFERAIVLHGNGSDEASIEGDTYFARLQNNTISYHQINAGDYGLAGNAAELNGGDANSNALITENILANLLKGSPRSSVVLNAALALQLIETTMTLEHAIEKINHIIDSGLALKKLRALQQGGK